MDRDERPPPHIVDNDILLDDWLQKKLDKQHREKRSNFKPKSHKNVVNFG